MSPRLGPSPLSPAITLLSVTLLCVTIMGSIAWSLHDTRPTGSSMPAALGSSGAAPTVVIVLSYPTPAPTATATPTSTPKPTATPMPSLADQWGRCTSQSRPGTICYSDPPAVTPPPVYPVCETDYRGVCRVPGNREDYSARQEVE